jgi:hypothetical protein
VNAAANARASAPTVVAATAAVAVATAPKDVLTAAPTREPKAVEKGDQKVRRATSAANAALKASVKNARWVKPVNRASHANPVKVVSSHAQMSGWTPPQKPARKASHAQSSVNHVSRVSHVSLAPNPAAAAVSVRRAAANVVSHALKPANPVASASSVTLSSRKWHWPTRRPWLPR